MNPTEIEFAVRDLVARAYDPETFPYELIGTYNASKVTVSRLKTGQTNAAKQPGDVLWRKKFFFRPAEVGADVGAIGDALAADPLTKKHKPRFILVTNGEQVHARDLQLDDTLNVEYALLDENSDFLLPLAGFERRAIVEEHPADIKAAKKLKKLYDALLAANPTWNSGHHTHELNLLMTRLLFCFYAEKTSIFDTPKIFTNTVTQHTTEDGMDTAPFLDRLFRIMNVEESKRPKTTPAVEAKFPYVNGSLFEDTVELPEFNRTARRQMLECGDLDWTTINPDIFGSMIQTIAQDGTRSDLGMHYTSMPNIMKVLQPLFLDDLHEAYEKAKDSVSKLESLLGRLSNIRVFDPACGSGNFLIISYKALRKFELQILIRIGDITPKSPLRLSGLSLQHFYGIDVVDFSCETAKLSLWIAEHQMNTTFKEVFGSARPTLPLGRIETIHRGNAVLMNWDAVCPPDDAKETFICGNPPYKGSGGQSVTQKNDLAQIFSPITKLYRELDYVSAWYLKASNYIKATKQTRVALVGTNSICQGSQVPLLWPLVLGDGVGIDFAHTSFKWQNNASNNAFIFCIIVGLGKTSSSRSKQIYTNGHIRNCDEISPYLTPGKSNLIVPKSSAPLNGLSPMIRGNMPYDGGNLILSPEEKVELIERYPGAGKLVKRLYGSKEFLQSVERHCLWITDNNLEMAVGIPPIAKRIDAVRKMRLSSPDEQVVQMLSLRPHQFREMNCGDALVVPAVFSEKRLYPTVGLIGDDAIVTNLAYAVFSPPKYLLAVLSSRLHWLWTHTIAGRHGMVIGYSSTVVYNNFPVPDLSAEQQRTLSDYSIALLKCRAKHPGKSMEWLYDDETMPEDLRNTHKENDSYIEEWVYGRKFKDDMQRLEHLFAMYARMKDANDHEGTLFGKDLKRKAV